MSQRLIPKSSRRCEMKDRFTTLSSLAQPREALDSLRAALFGSRRKSIPNAFQECSNVYQVFAVGNIISVMRSPLFKVQASPKFVRSQFGQKTLRRAVVRPPGRVRQIRTLFETTSP